MVRFPNAKINLGLNILRKRPDGYHDIESVFFPVAWSDVLEIVPGEKETTQMHLSGLAVPGNSADNLCLKAYHLLYEEFNLPAVDIYLHKVLPTGAGLGGGSADGTVSLLILNEMFNLGLSKEQLEEKAAELGSDCPFFVSNQPAYVTGRGEVLESFDLDLSSYHILLVNPGIKIGTAEAYAGVEPKETEMDLRSILSQPVDQWREQVVNQFEQSVFPNHPELPRIKSQLYEAGALYSSMTGSGSTLFGIFAEEPKILTAFSDLTCWKGKMAT